MNDFLLHRYRDDGTAEAMNSRGEWVPSIPLPLFLWPLGCRCSCGRRFWTRAGYQGHYALEHILFPAE